MCRNVIAAAAGGLIEISTSTLSFAEVCKKREVKDEGEDKIAAFFEVDYVLAINLDRAAGERARTLMMSGFSKLKPADACHLASAALANAEEMHTYDDKLLVLDGKIDKQNGTKLKICKPDPGGGPAPLLDAMKAPAGDTIDEPKAETLEAPNEIIPDLTDAELAEVIDRIESEEAEAAKTAGIADTSVASTAVPLSEKTLGDESSARPPAKKAT